MAKSSTKKRTPPQAADWLDSAGLDESAVDSNTRKKAKTLSSDSKFICYVVITIIYFLYLFARSIGSNSSIFEGEQR